MAQNLKPDRLDNRGGNKPTTSTKKLFIYRVEKSMHEKLKAYAIELNKQVEEEKNITLYTIFKHTKIPFRNTETQDLKVSLPIREARDHRNILEQESYFKMENITYTLEPLPCNTTEN